MEPKRMYGKRSSFFESVKETLTLGAFFPVLRASFRETASDRLIGTMALTIGMKMPMARAYRIALESGIIEG